MDLDSSEYVTDDTYSITTVYSIDYWFHHTFLESIEGTRYYKDEHFKKWHYVDGFLVNDSNDEKRIIRLDDETIKEVEAYNSFSEEDKIYKIAKYRAKSSIPEAMKLLKTLPEEYSVAQAEREFYEKILKYVGNYKIIEDTLMVQFSLSFFEKEEDESYYIYAKITPNKYYGDAYYNGSDLVHNRDYKLLDDGKGNFAFEAYYYGVNKALWELKDGKIVIYRPWLDEKSVAIKQ